MPVPLRKGKLRGGDSYGLSRPFGSGWRWEDACKRFDPSCRPYNMCQSTAAMPPLTHPLEGGPPVARKGALWFAADWMW